MLRQKQPGTVKNGAVKQSRIKIMHEFNMTGKSKIGMYIIAYVNISLGTQK